MKNKLFFISMILISTNLKAESYIMNLNNQGYKESIQIKSTINNEEPVEEVEISELVIGSETNANYKYDCTTAFECIETVEEGTMQVKSRTLNVEYELSEVASIGSFEWYFTGRDDGREKNKYPRNVEIQYDDNGVWISSGTMTGLVFTDEVVSYTIPFELPESNRYKFIFTGSTDGYSYTMLEYFKLKS